MSLARLYLFLARLTWQQFACLLAALGCLSFIAGYAVGRAVFG